MFRLSVAAALALAASLGPALAAAAALAIVSWALAWSTERPATQARAESTAPALQLASWAAGGELPETPEMLSVLGGSNE